MSNFHKSLKKLQYIKKQKPELELYTRIREDISTIDNSFLGRTLLLHMEYEGMMDGTDNMLELQLPIDFDMSIATIDLSCPADPMIYTNTEHIYYKIKDADALQIAYKFLMEGYTYKEEEHCLDNEYTHEDIVNFYNKNKKLFRKSKVDYLLNETDMDDEDSLSHISQEFFDKWNKKFDKLREK